MHFVLINARHKVFVKAKAEKCEGGYPYLVARLIFVVLTMEVIRKAALQLVNNQLELKTLLSEVL